MLFSAIVPGATGQRRTLRLLETRAMPPETRAAPRTMRKMGSIFFTLRDLSALTSLGIEARRARGYWMRARKERCALSNEEKFNVQDLRCAIVGPYPQGDSGSTVQKSFL